MQVPYTVTSQSITMFANGKMLTILASQQAQYDKAYEHLKLADHDADYLEGLANREQFVNKAVSHNNDVVVKDSGVFYKGDLLDNTLTDKLLDMLDEGFDVTPWVNFLERLMRNPSYNSRKALYDFLEHFKAPITQDGKFIAFKRVRSDYRDIYSGKFDNTPGSTIKMDRRDVDDNNDNTCSSGLHVCADEYLKGYATGDSYRTMVVEVDPEHVVAVPKDYQFSKMRTCEYTVLSEVTSEQQSFILSSTYFDFDDLDFDGIDFDAKYDF